MIPSFKLPSDWSDALSGETSKPYFQSLHSFVEAEYATHVCYPEADDIFAAFYLCPLHEVKVVMLGQDPYHEAGQAQGLCFSVPDGIRIPPSLRNIFKELQSDTGVPTPVNGDLTHWAQQGVLMLNATLTVREHKAGSHADGKLSPMPSSARSAVCATMPHFSCGAITRSKKPISSMPRVTCCSTRPTRRPSRLIADFSAITISARPTYSLPNTARLPSIGKHAPSWHKNH